MTKLGVKKKQDDNTNIRLTENCEVFDWGEKQGVPGFEGRRNSWKMNTTESDSSVAEQGGEAGSEELCRRNGGDGGGGGGGRRRTGGGGEMSWGLCRRRWNPWGCRGGAVALLKFIYNNNNNKSLLDAALNLHIYP